MKICEQRQRCVIDFSRPPRISADAFKKTIKFNDITENPRELNVPVKNFPSIGGDLKWIVDLRSSSNRT
jgi:hypothetical protein